MFIDLTLVLVCKPAAIDTLFLRVEQYLNSLDFARVDRVLISSHKDDPAADEDQWLAIADLGDELWRLDGARSIYMEFGATELYLGVQFVLDAPGSVTGFISVNMQMINRLHKKGIPTSFYEVIGSIAALARAVGGYGGYGAMDTPVSPEATLRELLAHPDDRDKWFDIHFVEASGLPGTFALTAWANDFERVERRGFEFFINRGFLDMCKKFG